jgi:DNA topoisomerase-1
MREPTIRNQLLRQGIRRTGSPRGGFRYRHAAGGRVRGDDLRRIRALVIPPAWRDVAIAPAPGSRVQAVGRDAAGRWQYLYGPEHHERRARQKYSKLIEFGSRLPELRRALRRDLAKPGLPLEKAQAVAVVLLSACALRPGAEEYARDNGSFGLATLRSRHVEIRGDEVRLRFRGKHGVLQDQTVTSRRVARLLRAMLRLPGRELLKYQDADGETRDIQRRHLNDYIKQAMGGRFSARDFRTWAGTLLCAAALRREHGADPGRGVERVIACAIRETADRLGNTPAVVRKSYVHPSLFAAFREKRKVCHGLDRPESFLAHRTAGLARAERELLALLRAHAPRPGQPLLTLLRAGVTATRERRRPAGRRRSTTRPSGEISSRRSAASPAT